VVRNGFDGGEGVEQEGGQNDQVWVGGLKFLLEKNKGGGRVGQFFEFGCLSMAGTETPGRYLINL
jgi:hypothetical protein